MLFRGECWHIVANRSKAKCLIYYNIRGMYRFKIKKNKKTDTQKKHKAREGKERKKAFEITRRDLEQRILN